MIELVVFASCITLISYIVNLHSVLKKYSKENGIEFDCPTIKFIFGGFLNYMDLIQKFAQNTYEKAMTNNIKIKLKKGIEPINKQNAIKYIGCCAVVFVGGLVFTYLDINFLSQDRLMAAETTMFMLTCIIFVVALLFFMLTGGRAFFTVIDQLTRAYNKSNKTMKRNL